MKTPEKAFNPAARERMGQLRALLEANGVPKPYIIFLQGKALRPFMESIGKEPFFKDGKIFADEIYRYNMDTGRYRKVEPRV